ncbi:Na+/H+ antiporter subunit E [Crassaminicella indica]|uniref:Na+/H+ antiporter subunit E n=1 Tax=Crassaminicella indica TaxID=2855394 RepID=A0ABX8RET0_9CLOT|nr:Na+/H+ antiporter subunit E [Crassaminicella indica]QXM06909.1 Na+/H+ antiporter subunit E [Crassaminicella indica]
MNKIIRLFFFIVFWFILAETINIERLFIGVVICIGVYVLNKELIVSDEGKNFQFLKKVYCYMTYLLILIKEIIVANFQVAKIVLSPKMNISPKIVRFHSKLKSDFYRTILANSITLTPGTLTVFMEGNELVVHCLKKEYIEDVLDSKFEKILLKIEE